MGDGLSPRAGMGAADNQASDCGREKDGKRFFSLMEFCFLNKLSWAELSISSWIFFWEECVVAILPNSSIASKMICLQMDYGLLVVLQEQRIEKRSQRMQPEQDLLIVSFLHRFCWEACLVPRSIWHQDSQISFKGCTLSRIELS